MKKNEGSINGTKEVEQPLWNQKRNQKEALQATVEELGKNYIKHCQLNSHSNFYSNNWLLLSVIDSVEQILN